MGQTVMACQVYQCRGPYSAHFGEKTLGGGAGWHPGKLGHKLRGDNLAYFMLKIFEEALQEIALSSTDCKVSLRMGRPPVLRHLTALHDSLSRSNSSVVPDSVKAVVANFPFSTPANVTALGDVATMQSPTADKLLARSMEFLREHIDKSVLSKDPVACLKEECGSEAFCFTDYEPRALSANSLTARLLNSTVRYPWDAGVVDVNRTLIKMSNTSAAQWTREISFFDAAAVKKAEEKHLGYHDRKNIFISHGIGSQISFRLQVKSERSYIWLCELQKGFLKYPPTMADLDSGALVILTKVSTQGKYNSDA